MKYILILLCSTLLFAALPPEVQKRIDMEMMQSNLQLQEESSIVVKASVIKQEEIAPKNAHKRRGSYYNRVNLVIKVEEILRNKSSISINETIYLEYSVFILNYMTGPKVYNIKVPTLHKSYIFYLDDNLRLSAENYSIDSLDNALYNEAKR